MRVWPLAGDGCRATIRRGASRCLDSTECSTEETLYWGGRGVAVDSLLFVV